MKFIGHRILLTAVTGSASARAFALSTKPDFPTSLVVGLIGLKSAAIAAWIKSTGSVSLLLTAEVKAMMHVAFKRVVQLAAEARLVAGSLKR